MSEDNWSNRSTFECSTCMYFVSKNDTILGRCRRNAPTIEGWPAVYDTDWCGNHKIDANCFNTELIFDLEEGEYLDPDIEEDDDEDDD